MGDYERTGGYRGGGRGGGGRYTNNTEGGGYQDGGGRGGGGGRFQGNRGRYNNQGGGRGQFYDDRQGGGQGFHGQNPPPFQGQGQFQGQGNQQYVNGDDGGYRGGGSGGRGRNPGRGRHDWGRTHYQSSAYQANQASRPRPGPRDEQEQLPPDIQLCAELPAHDKVITAMAFDHEKQQLYTGSQDGFVKVWDSATGANISSVEVGGMVDSILLAGGFLFVGLHKEDEGLIKIWNMATNAPPQQLPGHKGQVMCMVAHGATLISGGQDFTIRVWGFIPAASLFTSQLIIAKEQGGHSAAVQTLAVSGVLMFSADQAGCIKAWDLSSGACAQTLLGAHGSPVMQLIMFGQSHLLSASLDGTIKQWRLTDTPALNAVLITTAEGTFNPSDLQNEDGGDGQQGGRRQRAGPGGRPPPPPRGVLQMCGTSDLSQNPLLMVSYINDGCVRLFGLPAFNKRGVLPEVPDARVMVSVPGMALITGDNQGKVRVFAWAAEAGGTMEST